ncbi:MAG: ArnT family glycosyltransferase [Candidatus Binatia bacterium]
MRWIANAQSWLRPWMAACLLGGGVFLLVAFTSSHYGLTLDEPNYLVASDLELQWFGEFFRGLVRGELDSVLSDEKIKSAWRWDPYHVPHPPFSRLLAGLTKVALSPFIDKFTAYRLAPALLFALLVAVMYLWMAALFDRATGLFSALALVLMPNLFGFAHFVVTDMPLTTLWLLTVYCFVKGLRDWRWSLALAVVWGLALATKFPAFLIPIPLLLWAHLYHRHYYHNNVFSMVFLSPMIMVSLQPYLWHKTLPRIAMFLYDSVSRGFRWETTFGIFFFNKIYVSSNVPWYYPFFMTAVTIPETILILILIGLIAIARLKAQREIMVLFLFNAAFILSMGLFPGAVLHDVNRLMLPVLPFLAGLASCGFFLLARYLTERCQALVVLQGIKHLRAKLIGALSLLVIFPPALDLFMYHPFQLSYYNRLVGGIRGANQRGLEVTYFMEALTPNFLQFLNRDLPPNAVISGGETNYMLAYYQMEKRLRRDIRITDDMNFDYYLLLNRRSMFGPFHRALATGGRPYATVRLQGVPLVYLYKK